jgi:uncharacterized iron-regulated membrane protein
MAIFTTRQVRALFAIHKWTALLTGVFILFLSITGAIAVFREEIDRALTPAKVVTPGSTRLPLERTVSAATAAFPGSRAQMMTISHDPTSALVIRVRDGRQFREVFVNPYTAEVTGSRVGETVHNVLRQLHARFYVGGVAGRILVGFFGLTLLVSCLTGLFVYARFLKGRHFWTIRGGRLQLAISDWHKLIGITTLLFNIAIAFTGAVLGLELLANRVSRRLASSIHPAPSAAARADKPGELVGIISVDSAIAQAERATPGVTFTTIIMPVKDRAHWNLYGDARGGKSAEGGSWAIVESYTGRVIETFNDRDATGLTRGYLWMEPIHFGNFAGTGVKILWLILGFASGGLSVLGYVLWIMKRRKTRGPGRAVEDDLDELAEARAPA